MAIIIFLTVTFFLGFLETLVPFIMRKTVVFGVSIPDEKSNVPKIRYYKKIYVIAAMSGSIIALIFFLIGAFIFHAADNQLAIIGLIIQFGIIFWSLSFYFYLHGKILRLKKEQQWYSDQTAVKVTELNLRQSDEMLPWYLFTFPMIITIGLGIFTFTQYSQFPAAIPIHWGADGKPDHFVAKTYFSIISLLVVLLTMQWMFLGIHELTKKSGIKMSAVNRRGSRSRQLLYRKYTSWFLLLMTILITVLFSLLQVTTLYNGIYNTLFMMLIPLVFLMITLASSLLFAIKVGKLNAQLDSGVKCSEKEKWVDVDEDHFWKGGLFYYNKNDPSIFVEKRFGIGWTLNFAHPIGYVVIFIPLLFILFIGFVV
ncbi:DUF1648 domain-containing protein [Niallia sp. 03133]|uniref:DUF1648 domain-containing protein n=1 Tax=Niallia sp. 03133 TaxID=3458060 RepID=UPI0040440F94